MSENGIYKVVLNCCVGCKLNDGIECGFVLTLNPNLDRNTECDDRME